MGYLYPPPAPTVAGDTITIHRYLADPTRVNTSVSERASQRFIADSLLTGRYQASGGSVIFNQDEPLYLDRAPEIVAPGGEYPMSGFGIGPDQVASVKKWGEDVPVTDEAIKRLGVDPVNKAFVRLVNTMVKTVDSVALAVIASQVTAAKAATAPWSTATAEQIFLDIGLAQAAVADLQRGYAPDTVVLSETAWTYVMAKYQSAGYLPRENGSAPALTGDFPVIGGLRFLKTSNLPFANTALLVDSTALGGMADEQLGGPGYVGAEAGVETKSIREEKTDSWLLRARRITVPVVLAPGAAYKITGVTS